MGNSESKEEKLGRAIANLPFPKLTFPGNIDISNATLENQKDVLSFCENLIQFAEFLASNYDPTGGVATSILFKCINYILNQYSVEAALLSLQIKTEIARSAVVFVSSELAGISRQLQILTGVQSAKLGKGERMAHLVTADNDCYKVLLKFMDGNFYLKQNPFATAVLLCNFIAMYVPIATAYYKLTKDKNVKLNLIKVITVNVKDTLKEYEESAISRRLYYLDSGSRIVFPFNDGDYVTVEWIYDNFLPDKTVYSNAVSSRGVSVFAEVKPIYRRRLEETYREYFLPTWQLIDKFTEATNLH